MKNSLICFNINKFLVLTCFMLILMYLYVHPLQARELLDIDESWARMEIKQLEAIGVVSGYPDGSFLPEGNITRAEFSKLLVEALGQEEEALALLESEAAFADLTADYWANSYIKLGKEQGWLKGKGIVFEPDACITREEAACILSRALEVTVLAAEDIEFTDRKDISDWAQQDVALACSQGLIQGFPDGSFRAAEKLSREQSVVMLRRIMDKKGLLFQFSGIIKEAGDESALILVGSKEYEIVINDEAILYDRGKLIASLADAKNTRLAFNINDQGEIIFAELSYSDRYLNITYTQEQDIYMSEQEPAHTEGLMSSKTSAQDEIHPLSGNNPGLSILTARRVSGISRIATEKKLDGEGTVIAIIDSGIDPINQDLQRSSKNNRKVIDWVNFTDEGRVKIDQAVSAPSGADDIETLRGKVILPHNVESLSGQYRYGFWNEEWISYLHRFDYTGNNSSNDNILVLLVDSDQAGKYNVVYVDTNNNMRLDDEVPLHVYREYKHNYASFPKTDDLPQGFSFVLSDIADDATELVFGYDSEGHGTHVSGIAAASGLLQGVAPGAQLMVLKVADCTGVASMENTLKAIKYAVDRGADIINLSLGYNSSNADEIDNFRKQVNDLAENTLICTATGNDGPGLASLSTPGDLNNVLSVGAYIAPDMWETDYGWRTDMDGLWYFNSVGPGKYGNWKPDMLAPGSAVSTYPVWTGKRYYLNEGSSMAAPFVSGSAALLMEGMWKSSKGFNSLMIKEALLHGSRELDNIASVEQGHGALDLYSSWQILDKTESLVQDTRLSAKSELYDESEGIFARELLPGIAKVKVENKNREEILVNWTSQSDWMTLDKDTTYIPAGAERELEITYKLPEKAGLYCGFIQGKIEDESGRDIEILNTLIVPEKWDGRGRTTLYDSLPAGQIKRYYFSVPEDMDELELELKVLGSRNDLQGRARLHIFDPAGKLYQVTQYAGFAPSGIAEKRAVKLNIDKPASGNWEVVAYSSATLHYYDKKSSEFVINARVSGKTTNQSYPENDLIIGAAIPKEESSADQICLNIINADSKEPYNGRLLINNRLYLLENGRVKIHNNVQREAVDIVIRKVF